MTEVGNGCKVRMRLRGEETGLIELWRFAAENENTVGKDTMCIGLEVLQRNVGRHIPVTNMRSLRLVFVHDVRFAFGCSVLGKVEHEILSSCSLDTFQRCVFEPGRQRQTQVMDHREGALSRGRAPLHLLSQM